MSEKKRIKSALESLMFVWGRPVEVREAGELFEVSGKKIYDYMKELQEEYESQGRGIRIRQIDQSFQLCTASENAEYIRRFCTPIKERRLSQPALEVLAIIAYRQPVSRGEMEEIRGIKCDRVVEGLAKKGLIEAKGRGEGVGRPVLYGTTKLFLEKFGFISLKELPQIEEVGSLLKAGEWDEDERETEECEQVSLKLDEKK